MNVLVCCEESQEVCKAFRAMGHEAFSCDLQKPSGGREEWHIQEDCTRLLDGNTRFVTMDGHIHTISGSWDLIIAHPPCTYMANSGAVRMRVGGGNCARKIPKSNVSKNILYGYL